VPPAPVEVCISNAVCVLAAVVGVALQMVTVPSHYFCETIVRRPAISVTKLLPSYISHGTVYMQRLSNQHINRHELYLPRECIYTIRGAIRGANLSYTT
jgi:hypothetical protein